MELPDSCPAVLLNPSLCHIFQGALHILSLSITLANGKVHLKFCPNLFSFSRLPLKTFKLLCCHGQRVSHTTGQHRTPIQSSENSKMQLTVFRKIHSDHENTIQLTFLCSHLLSISFKNVEMQLQGKVTIF